MADDVVRPGRRDVDAGESRYAHLPDPIRPDQMITSLEASPLPDEKDDYWREVEWMLRVTGGV